MRFPAIADLSEQRRDLTSATQRLLGDTIGLSDEDWSQPTSLPGWMRGHVATHVCCQARAMAEIMKQIVRTKQPVAWRTCESNSQLIEGARRSTLQIQEDLDQSTGELNDAFSSMGKTLWKTHVVTSQGLLPATVLPLARLNEVVLHHIDLNIGFSFADIDARIVHKLLPWNLFRAEPRFNQVELTMTTDDGMTVSIGEGFPITVFGTASALLGWITGRLDNSVVLGAEKLNLSDPV